MQSDSEDEEFLGFTDDDLKQEHIEDYNSDVELTEEDLLEIDRELEREASDPKFEAYQDEWLKNFDEIPGPIGDENTAYGIFSQYFDDNVIQLLVNETNRYYEQYMC